MFASSSSNHQNRHSPSSSSISSSSSASSSSSSNMPHPQVESSYSNYYDAEKHYSLASSPHSRSSNVSSSTSSNSTSPLMESSMSSVWRPSPILSSMQQNHPSMSVPSSSSNNNNNNNASSNSSNSSPSTQSHSRQSSHHRAPHHHHHHKLTPSHPSMYGSSSGPRIAIPPTTPHSSTSSSSNSSSYGDYSIPNSPTPGNSPPPSTGSMSPPHNYHPHRRFSMPGLGTHLTHHHAIQHHPRNHNYDNSSGMVTPQSTSSNSSNYSSHHLDSHHHHRPHHQESVSAGSTPLLMNGRTIVNPTSGSSLLPSATVTSSPASSAASSTASKTRSGVGVIGSPVHLSRGSSVSSSGAASPSPESSHFTRRIVGMPTSPILPNNSIAVSINTPKRSLFDEGSFLNNTNDSSSGPFALPPRGSSSPTVAMGIGSPFVLTSANSNASASYSPTAASLSFKKLSTSSPFAPLPQPALSPTQMEIHNNSLPSSSSSGNLGRLVVGPGVTLGGLELHHDDVEEVEEDEHNDGEHNDPDIDIGIASPPPPETPSPSPGHLKESLFVKSSINTNINDELFPPQALSPSSSDPYDHSQFDMSNDPNVNAPVAPAAGRSASNPNRIVVRGSMLQSVSSILSPWYHVHILKRQEFLSTNNSHLQQALQLQGCPLCCSSDLNSFDSGNNNANSNSEDELVILECKDLGCNHVAHSSCIGRAALANRQQLQQSKGSAASKSSSPSSPSVSSRSLSILCRSHPSHSCHVRVPVESAHDQDTTILSGKGVSKVSSGSTDLSSDTLMNSGGIRRDRDRRGSTSVMGSRQRVTWNFSFYHRASDVELAHYQALPDQHYNSIININSNSEFLSLLNDTDDDVSPSSLIYVTQGRFVFDGFCESTGEHWHFDALYDLEKYINHRTLDLVIKANDGSVLTISLQRMQQQQQQLQQQPSVSWLVRHLRLDVPTSNPTMSSSSNTAAAGNKLKSSVSVNSSLPSSPSLSNRSSSHRSREEASGDFTEPEFVKPTVSISASASPVPTHSPSSSQAPLQHFGRSQSTPSIHPHNSQQHQQLYPQESMSASPSPSSSSSSSGMGMNSTMGMMPVGAGMEMAMAIPHTQMPMMHDYMMMNMMSGGMPPVSGNASPYVYVLMPNGQIQPAHINQFQPAIVDDNHSIEGYSASFQGRTPPPYPSPSSASSSQGGNVSNIPPSGMMILSPMSPLSPAPATMQTTHPHHYQHQQAHHSQGHSQVMRPPSSSPEPHYRSGAQPQPQSRGGNVSAPQDNQPPQYPSYPAPSSGALPGPAPHPVRSVSDLSAYAPHIDEADPYHSQPNDSTVSAGSAQGKQPSRSGHRPPAQQQGGPRGRRHPSEASPASATRNVDFLNDNSDNGVQNTEFQISDLEASKSRGGSGLGSSSASAASSPSSASSSSSPSSSGEASTGAPQTGLVLLAKSQAGSRLLQSKLSANDPAYLTVVFNEVFDSLSELMIDLFGNYLCQRLISLCSADQRVSILRKVLPDIVNISCDRQGTRAVQKLVEAASTHKERQIIIDALSGFITVVTPQSQDQHSKPQKPATIVSMNNDPGNTSKRGNATPTLLHMIRDANGSHVIHAILDHFPSSMLQPILKAAFRAVRSLGIDQHGLCVLKKCMTMASPAEYAAFAHRVLEHVLEYVNNQYGNYLIQHLIERSTGAISSNESDPASSSLYAQCNEALYRGLKGHFARLSRQKFSSNVVEKCLRFLDRQLVSAIISELTHQDVIASLLQCSYGNYVMQNVLYVADKDQAALVVERINHEHVLSSLRKNIRHKWERLLQLVNVSSNTGFGAGLPPPQRDDRDNNDDDVSSSSFSLSPSSALSPSNAPPPFNEEAASFGMNSNPNLSPSMSNSMRALSGSMRSLSVGGQSPPPAPSPALLANDSSRSKGNPPNTIRVLTPDNASSAAHSKSNKNYWPTTNNANNSVNSNSITSNHKNNNNNNRQRGNNVSKHQGGHAQGQPPMAPMHSHHQHQQHPHHSNSQHHSHAQNMNLTGSASMGSVSFQGRSVSHGPHSHNHPSPHGQGHFPKYNNVNKDTSMNMIQGRNYQSNNNPSSSYPSPSPSPSPPPLSSPSQSPSPMSPSPSPSSSPSPSPSHAHPHHSRPPLTNINRAPSSASSSNRSSNNNYPPPSSSSSSSSSPHSLAQRSISAPQHNIVNSNSTNSSNSSTSSAGVYGYYPNNQTVAASSGSNNQKKHYHQNQTHHHSHQHQ